MFTLGCRNLDLVLICDLDAKNVGCIERTCTERGKEALDVDHGCQLTCPK